jgi:MFS family permease
VNQGIDSQVVAYSLSFEAVIVFAVTIPIGYVASRVQLRYLLIASHLVSICFILLMFVSTEGWHVFLANALFGVSATSQMIAQSVLWPDYFGKGNIGVIRGLTIPVTTALSFAGPPLAGTIFDFYGSYTPAWIMSIGLIIASGALFLVTPKPSTPLDTGLPV